MPAQWHNFCFTSWRTKSKYVKFLLALPVHYIIFQIEKCPTTGKLHLQGYCELHEKKRLGGIKKLFKNKKLHIEPREGTQAQAIGYCVKSETYVDGPFHAGTPRKQGKRSDLDSLAIRLRSEEPLESIFLDYPGHFIRYQRSIINFRNVFIDRTPRTWAPTVYVLIGPPGSGKSRYAWESKPDLYTLPVPSPTAWFDGYIGQDTVLFDDFDGSWFKRTYLLQLLDRYPMQVPIKGGFVNWKPRTIFITSNDPISCWYQKHHTAILRRVTKIFYFRNGIIVNEQCPTAAATALGVATASADQPPGITENTLQKDSP